LVDDQKRDMESAFNEGMLQIQRLNYLWMQINNYSRTGKYTDWRWSLDAIWRELSRDAIKSSSGVVKPGEYDKVIKENPWFKQYVRLRGIVDVEFVNSSKSIPGSMGRYYNALHDLEIFLRTLQDSVGKGGKYKDMSEDEMD